VKDRSKRYAAVGIYAPNVQVALRSKGAGVEKRQQWDEAFFQMLRVLFQIYDTLIVCGDFNMDWSEKYGQHAVTTKRYKTFMHENGFGEPVSMPPGKYDKDVSVITQNAMEKRCATYKRPPRASDKRKITNESRMDYFFVRRSPTATTTPAAKGAAASSSVSSSAVSAASSAPTVAEASTTASLHASDYTFGQYNDFWRKVSAPDKPAYWQTKDGKEEPIYSDHVPIWLTAPNFI
jgi:endonuclease/exonuclease/phosphatase family metal-dependent hydrolase